MDQNALDAAVHQTGVARPLAERVIQAYLDHLSQNSSADLLTAEEIEALLAAAAVGNPSHSFGGGAGGFVDV